MWGFQLETIQRQREQPLNNIYDDICILYTYIQIIYRVIQSSTDLSCALLDMVVPYPN